MGAVESLERITKIIETLEPVGDKGQGEPLRASDWNQIVDAVVTLARLTAHRERSTEEALESGFAPVGHTHAGEVGASWFDARTRELLEGRSGAGVAESANLARMEREMKFLRERTESLEAENERLLREMAEVRDRLLGQERSVGKALERVENLKGLENNFTDLNKRFGDLRGGVTEALELADRFQDEQGNPVDFDGLIDRVDGLEDVRDNLRLADGTLGRLRDFQVDLAELRDESVQKSTLEDLVAGHLQDPALLRESGLVDEVTASVEEKLGGDLQAMGTRIDEFGTTLEQVDQRIDQQDERTASVEAGLEKAQGALQRIPGLATRLDQMGTRTNELRTRVDGLGPRVSALEALPERVDGLRADLDATQGRLSDEMERIDGSLKNVNTSLSGLSDHFASQEAMSDLGKQVDELGTRLGQAEENLGTVADDLELQRSRVTDVGERLDSVESRTEGLDGWRGVVDRSIADLDRRTTANAAMGDRLASVETGLKQLSSWRDGTGRRLDTVETRLDEVETRADNVESTVAEHGTRLDGLGSDVKGITGRVATLETWRTETVAPALDRVATHDTQLEEVHGRLDMLQSGQADLNEWRDATITRIDDLESGVADLGRWRKTVDEDLKRVATQDADLAELSDQVRTLKKTTDGLVAWRKAVEEDLRRVNNTVGRFDGLETRIDALETNRPGPGVTGPFRPV